VFNDSLVSEISAEDLFRDDADDDSVYARAHTRARAPACAHTSMRTHTYARARMHAHAQAGRYSRTHWTEQYLVGVLQYYSRATTVGLLQ
jgi:hypothetical protein